MNNNSNDDSSLDSILQELHDAAFSDPQHQSGINSGNASSRPEKSMESVNLFHENSLND